MKEQVFAKISDLKTLFMIPAELLRAEKDTKSASIGCW